MENVTAMSCLQGAVMVMIVWQLNLLLPTCTKKCMQSAPITTNVVSSNPTQARYTQTTLCDKVCQRLTACWWFSLGTPTSSTNKIDSQFY